MADVVTTRTIIDSKTHLCLHLTNVSDGTGETNVAKIVRANYKATDGNAPDSLDIYRIRWAVQGFTSVKLSWDHTTDDTAMILSGNGYDDFDGNIPEYRDPFTLNDPRSTGGPGDLLLSTSGAVSGATYEITIWIKKAAV